MHSRGMSHPNVRFYCVVIDAEQKGKRTKLSKIQKSLHIGASEALQGCPSSEKDGKCSYGPAKKRRSEKS